MLGFDSSFREGVGPSGVVASAGKAFSAGSMVAFRSDGEIPGEILWISEACIHNSI